MPSHRRGDRHRSEPQIEQYIAAAQRAGLRITGVTETHIYADYVSGARELAARTGAQLYLSDMGTADWKYAYAADAGATLLRDGDRFMIGNVRLEVLHTPGHTPEHIAFLVTDTAHADLPMGIASGDFVFVSDVGRPDLRKLGQSTKEVKTSFPADRGTQDIGCALLTYGCDLLPRDTCITTSKNGRCDRMAPVLLNRECIQQGQIV